MRLGGVPQLVDHFHACVQGGIVANGVFTAGDVVIDGAGDADAGHAVAGQILRAAEGTVAADDHHAFDAVVPAGLHCLLKCPPRCRIRGLRR